MAAPEATIICLCSILAMGKSEAEENIPGQQGSGTAYVPQFLLCSLPCDNASRICGDGRDSLRQAM